MIPQGVWEQSRKTAMRNRWSDTDGYSTTAHARPLGHHESLSHIRYSIALAEEDKATDLKVDRLEKVAKQIAGESEKADRLLESARKEEDRVARLVACGVGAGFELPLSDRETVPW